MADTDKEFEDLDGLFAAAREDRGALPPALRRQILSDGLKVQGNARPLPGIWSQLRDLLGGWPGLGGLVAAGVAGVWIGIAPPAALPDPVQLVTQTSQTTDIFDSFDLVSLMDEDG
ncbi:MAG: hypothetical protein AB8B51_01255 [Sedimentitalea sp.]